MKQSEEKDTHRLEKKNDKEVKNQLKLEEKTKVAGISNTKKRKSILEKHKKLEETVLEFPLMFHKSFKAGILKIPPVKFEINKDINKVEPTVSKLKLLAYSGRVALKEWQSKESGYD